MRLPPNQILENRRTYIEALKSNEYRQIAGMYSDGHDGYCAVGLIGKACENDVRGMGQACKLVDLMPNAGCKLLSMNDNAQMTFEEIANVIEQRPHDFFSSQAGKFL